MRLTLRTLLAYLDDTLDPAQTKLIGQKVAESPAAQDLITRIKEVVRRRRLTVPPTTGPLAKLEPNMVSEYIDSVLPSEQLTEVEEICLESDVNLAEVAACHQILTVILSEPILVPPTARHRMYGLIKGREAIPYRKAASAVAVGNVYEEKDRHGEEDSTLLLGLPFYGKHGAWFRRLAPIAAVLLLVVGGAIALIKALPSAENEPKKSTPIAKVEAKDKATATAAAAKLQDNPKKEEAKKEDTNSSKEEKPQEPKKEEAKKEEPKKEETKPVKEEKPPVKEEKPAAGPRREVGRVVTGDAAGLLLQKTSDREAWQRVLARRPIFTNDSLLSLPGYRSELQLNNGVTLALWGTLPDPQIRSFTLDSAVVLHESQDFDLDLTLDRGRIVITNNKANGASKARIRFIDDVRWKDKAWDYHQEAWEVTLQEPGAEVAMEFFGLYLPGVPFSREPGGEGPMAAMGFFVLKGRVELKVRYDVYNLREPRGPALFFWDNLGQAPRGPQNQDRLPPWADRTAVQSRMDLKLKSALSALNARMTEKKPVDVVLAEFLKESEPANRGLAVYCLGATDDLSALLDCLGDQDHLEIRRTAVMMLRNWIGRRADHDSMLFQVLEKKHKANSAEIIMELLHDFSKEQRDNPVTYETLIAYLKNDMLPIRELALFHLFNLVPDIAQTIRFDPAGPSDQREAAFEQWKKIIPDGKLPPKGKPAGSK